ncbi:hypothetical protein FOZ62_013772, partial [Perkinsus olseni]
ASERLWKAHEEAVSSVQVLTDPGRLISVGVGGDGCKVWSWEGRLLRVIHSVGSSTRPIRPSKELVMERDLRYYEEGDHRLRDLLEKAKAITEAEPVEKARHRKSILQRLMELKGHQQGSQQGPNQDCSELCRRSYKP